MSLAKLPFLSSAVVASYVLMTPPQPKVPAEQHSKVVRPYERFFSSVVRSAMTLAKGVALAPWILEIAVLVASRFPSTPIARSLLRALVRGSAGLVERISFSRTFLVGWCIGIAGTALRYQCYQALGSSFTFELTTRKEQKLVTDGPYRYVRHPSYTTAIVGGLGFVLASHVARGSWMQECGISQTLLGKSIGAMHAILGTLLGLSVVYRTPGEDEMLRSHFGEEWEEYAKRVPYRLIPYIY